MSTVFLNDPALTTTTFLRNDRLAAAFTRLAARASVAPAQAPAPLISGAESPGSDAQDNRPIPGRRCAVCRKEISADDVTAIAENDGWGKTVWVHPDCHPENKDLPIPTEDQLKEQYLALNGWERLQISATRVLYSDPYTYDALSLEDAHKTQETRDAALHVPTYADCNLII